jgi:uncharacterized iron-regulated membrane protein
MLGTRAIRLWCRVHKWSSLACTAVLLLLCLTGLPLIFHQEIDRLLDDRVPAPAMPADAPKASLDRIVEAAQQRYPREFVQFFFWDSRDRNVIELRMAPAREPAPDQIHTLRIDARTAQILDEPATDSGVMRFILKLHGELLSDLPGEIVLAVIGLVFAVAIVSGVVVYGPFMRRLDFGTVRSGNSARLKWLDLHNLLGIVTLAWVLVVTVTGVINTLTVPLFALWRAEMLPALLEPHQDKPALTHFRSVDAAVDAVRQAFPERDILSVVLPNTRYATPRHFLVWTKGMTPITARLFTPVLVDGESGVLTQAPDLPWYLRTLQVSRPLHFGDYGGMPLKLIWAVLDLITIVLLGSGLYLWLARRGSPLEARLGDIDQAERPNAGGAVRWPVS